MTGQPLKGGETADQGKSGPGHDASQQGDSNDMKSHSSRTSGTNRDFDEKGDSINQGHGHPREERGGNNS